MGAMWIVTTAAIGLLAGTCGGLFGVGGGIVIVPLLILAFKTDPKVAIGTSLATIIPTAIMASWRHHKLGHVDWRIAAGMAIGSVAGALIGASLTAHVPAETLKKGFAVFLVLTAARLLWK